MSAMQTSLTDAFVAAVEKIKNGLFINDLDIGKKIKTQKSRLNQKSCCAGSNEIEYKLRPKPIIPVVKVSDGLGPLKVKLLPWMYVTTHFSSPFWPKYDIVELPILEFSDNWEGLLGELEVQFRSAAELVLVSNAGTDISKLDIWDIRQKMCHYIPEMYGRKGNVQISFIETPDEIEVMSSISNYLRVANLSVASAILPELHDRLLHSTLNQQMHIFKMRVFDLAKV